MCGIKVAACVVATPGIAGHIWRRDWDRQTPYMRGLTEVICPLCDRPIPAGAKASRHHLVPKLKGGARGEVVLLHQICHSAIHARFSEAELARRFNTVAALRAAPELADFLAWVRTKPGDFHAPTRTTQSRSRQSREAWRRHR